MIGQTISHYKILEKLGGGGMGVVYKAQDLKLDRFVALKFLPHHLSTDEDEKKRFIHEAKAASALDHPNICTIYEIGETEDGQLFIVMAYYEGETLKKKVVSSQLSVDSVIDIAMQIAQGLAKAHHHGITHRDIKPANIFITTDGVVKILDWGLAKVAHLKLTKTGSTLGTVAYMSPEQAKGKEVDHRTDIWSLGVVLYEMLSGELPFKGENEPAMIYAILNEKPEPMIPTGRDTDVPMELERIVNKAMAKKPDERYRQIHEMLADLKALAATVFSSVNTAQKSYSWPWTSVAKTGTTGAGSTGLAKRWAFIALPLVLILLAAVALFYFRETAPLKTPAKRKTLVVLPFENLSAAEDEYFADGITEEIISRLAVVNGLGVISRTSAIQYKKTPKTIRQIGQDLGVDYVLEGTVRWDRPAYDGSGPSRVRITSQLIRIADDMNIWTEQYDRVLDRIFEVQSEIAEQVAKQLDLTLLEPERKALQARPTRNLEAYDFYLRGKQHSPFFLDKQKQERAIEMFEKAVALDSTFAAAYAALSRVHSSMYYFVHDETEERLRKARVAAERALRLQPDLPEAQEGLAYYHYYRFSDYERALKLIENLRKARPNYSPHLIGMIQRRQGKWLEALANLEEACKLNPLDAYLMWSVGLVNCHLRRYRIADSWFEQATALAPENAVYKCWQVMNLVPLTGRTDKAWPIIESIPGFRGKDYFVLLFYRYEKRYQEALKRIAALSEEAFEIEWVYHQKHLAFAETYWLMKNQPFSRAHADTSRRMLEKEIQKRSGIPRLHSALGFAYAYLSRKVDAIREGKRAVELEPVAKDADEGPDYVRHLAQIYTIVGEHEAAIAQLEYLMSIPSLLSASHLRLDPIWDDLREYPRFRKLLNAEGN
ncbi:protein kinase [candidate division KSB1 bacterium]|nr:protein kinase [candidate division KSB1 bacterium]